MFWWQLIFNILFGVVATLGLILATLSYISDNDEATAGKMQGLLQNGCTACTPKGKGIFICFPRRDLFLRRSNFFWGGVVQYGRKIFLFTHIKWGPKSFHSHEGGQKKMMSPAHRQTPPLSVQNAHAAHSIKKWVCMLDCASNFYPHSMEIWTYLPPFYRKHRERMCCNFY